MHIKQNQNRCYKFCIPSLFQVAIIALMVFLGKRASVNTCNSLLGEQWPQHRGLPVHVTANWSEPPYGSSLCASNVGIT